MRFASILIAALLVALVPATAKPLSFEGVRSSRSLLTTPVAAEPHPLAALTGAPVDRHADAAPTMRDESRKLPARSAAETVLGFEAYVYDADIRLSGDDDRDGFFRLLETRFDVDTVHLAQTLYARLYLSQDLGPWQELYTSPPFTVFGTSPTDDYVVVTELLSGYPSAHYDLLLELYDADSRRLLARLGPAETSAFSLLPLEDRARDLPPAPPRRVATSSGGGGSMGLMMLPFAVMALLTFGLRRRRKGARP